MTDKTQVYVRVKRRNQTFCLLCDLQDSLADLKQTLGLALQQHSTDISDVATLRLLDAKQEVLDDDSATLESMQLLDDALLFVVLPVADGEWEAVDVVSDSILTDA